MHRRVLTGVVVVLMVALGTDGISLAQVQYPPRTPVAPGVRIPPAIGTPVAPGPGATAPPQAPVPRAAPPRQASPPPSGRRRTGPPQRQAPAEYAFRPDLTNPQFGECLRLEKNWKALYQQYYQYYQSFRMMARNDPRTMEMSYFLNTLKSQLDAAWRNFSSRCIYFPKRP